MPPLGGHSWHTDRASSCSDTLLAPELHHKETLLGKGGVLKETWERKMGTDPKHLERPSVPSQRCPGKCPRPSQQCQEQGNSRLTLQNTDFSRASFGPFLLMYKQNILLSESKVVSAGKKCQESRHGDVWKDSQCPPRNSKAKSSNLLIGNSRCAAGGKGWNLEDGHKFDYKTRTADHLER